MSLVRVQHQEGALRVLRAAVAADRLPHAYLFAGPRGVGKGLAARELAKRLFCESPRDAANGTTDSCDVCTQCRRVERDVHPDLFWFRKEPDRNDFRIGLVTRREGHDAASPPVTIVESVMLHPMEAERTVTVLDDAELLNRHAANALLKCLEEPSPHAVLVLLCSDPSELPGTVLSRCQWVRFRPLPEAFVVEKLAAALADRNERAEEDPQAPAPRSVSAEEVAYVCHLAGGSVERAARLAGSGLWDLKRDLVAALAEMDEAAAIEMAGAVGAWARTRVKAERVTREAREETAIRRRATRTALAAVGAAFRDAMVLSAGGAGNLALENADQVQQIERLAGWPMEACARAVGLLAEAQAQISRYVHLELAAENALIQISRLRLGAAAHA